MTTAGVDFDSDGDVDLDDFGYLQNCLGIDNVVGTNPACADADANDDGNVNVSDLTQFISCLSGPQIPAAPACLD